MKIFDYWKWKFIGRKANDNFSEFFRENGVGTGVFISYLSNKENRILNLYVYFSNDVISDIGTYKAKALYRGHGRPVNREEDLSSVDFNKIIKTLDSSTVARYDEIVDKLLRTYEGNEFFSVVKNNKNTFTIKDEKKDENYKFSKKNLRELLEISDSFIEIITEKDSYCENFNKIKGAEKETFWRFIREIKLENYFDDSEIKRKYLERDYRKLCEIIPHESLRDCEKYTECIGLGLLEVSGQNSTPLYLSINNNKTEIFHWLLSNGADPNEKGISHGTPISVAISQEKISLCEDLLKFGARLPEKIDYRLGIKSKEIVEFLLKSGLKIDGYTAGSLCDDHGEEYLLSYIDNVDIDNSFINDSFNKDRKKIIDKLFEIDLSYDLKNSILDSSFKFENDGSIKKSLKLNFPISSYSLKRAIDRGEDCLRLLIDNGAHINVGDGEVLIYAIRYSSLGIVKNLVNYGADVDLHPKDSSCGLYFAIFEKKEDIAEYLLDLGADVHGKSYENLLHHAITYSSSNIVRKIIERGFDVNSTDRNGTSALEWVIWREGSDALFSFMLDNGAKLPEKLDDKEYVSRAAFAGNIAIVKKLLELGCPVNSALGSAALKMQFEICKFLIEYGVDVNQQDSLGRTPLLMACSMYPFWDEDKVKTMKMVEYLISQGANPNISDNKGNNPQDFIVKLNKELGCNLG